LLSIKRRGKGNINGNKKKIKRRERNLKRKGAKKTKIEKKKDTHQEKKRI